MNPPRAPKKRTPKAPAAQEPKPTPTIRTFNCDQRSMRLWKLERKDDAWVDEARACIVRAPDEQEARKLAGTCAGDEGTAVWMDAGQVTCTEVTRSGEAEVILCDVFEA